MEESIDLIIYDPKPVNWRKMLEKAYAEGFRAGQERMRDRIFNVIYTQVSILLGTKLANEIESKLLNIKFPIEEAKSEE